MSSAAEANARVSAAAVSRDYSRPVKTYLHDAGGKPAGAVSRVPDRWSTCLGKRVAIMQPVGECRAREDLSFPTFTFTLRTVELPDGATWCDESHDRWTLPNGRFGYPQAVDLKGQEKFVKGLDKLQRASERAAKRAAPKVKPAKVATVRVQAGRVLEVVGLPRGYSFMIEEVG